MVDVLRFAAAGVMLVAFVVAIFSALGPRSPELESITATAAAASHPPEIASAISGMIVADETLDIPRSVQRDGTVIVLWVDHNMFSSRAAAVVYEEKDGRLYALRFCPLPKSDVYSGKYGDKHKISSTIDENTTSVRCENAEQAASRGRANPMLIVEGRSSGVPLFGSGEGDATFREFGIL